MTELLIPFGIDVDSRLIVEPEDAERGRACNCVCPGCKAPLQSKHPQNRRKHFSHDSSHPDATPIEKCPFSASVAVAMMARNLVSLLSGKHIKVTDHKIDVLLSCCSRSQSAPVATMRQVAISEASREALLPGMRMDFVLSIDGRQLYICLFYKNKLLPKLDKKYLQKIGAGVLGINCDSFDSDFLRNNKDLRYSEIVLQFLLSEGKRHWLFHPREAKIISKINNEHKCRNTRKRIKSGYR